MQSYEKKRLYATKRLKTDSEDAKIPTSKYCFIPMGTSKPYEGRTGCLALVGLQLHGIHPLWKGRQVDAGSVA